MIKSKMLDKAEFEKPRIKEGVYNCVCKEVKEISEGKYGARIVIVAEIVDREIPQSTELGKVVHLKMTPGSGSTKVMKAFGFEYDVGKDFVFDDLVGKTARCIVEDYETRDLDEEGKAIIASSITKFKLLEEEKPVTEEKVIVN